MEWPYGYYTFLRIAVFLTSLYGGLRAFSHEKNGWGVALIGIAILFNPLIPVYLSESAWAPIDVISACVVGVSAFALSSKEEQKPGSS